jgi:hypothetical protein
MAIMQRGIIIPHSRVVAGKKLRRAQVADIF